MTQAEQCVLACEDEIVRAERSLVTRRCAKAIDPTVRWAWTDDLLFYYFSDGSKMGTKPRAKGGIQFWVAA